jgi:hypothetical protein
MPSPFASRREGRPADNEGPLSRQYLQESCMSCLRLHRTPEIMNIQLSIAASVGGISSQGMDGEPSIT